MEAYHDDLLLTLRYLRDAVHAMCLATDKLMPAQRALAEQAIVRADAQINGSAGHGKLWAVRRTSSWRHYDGGGGGTTRDIVHVATSPEQCRADMNAFWQRERDAEQYAERKSTLVFEANAVRATGRERNLSGGGYASYERSYEIVEAPCLCST